MNFRQIVLVCFILSLDYIAFGMNSCPVDDAYLHDKTLKISYIERDIPQTPNPSMFTQKSRFSCKT